MPRETPATVCVLEASLPVHPVGCPLTLVAPAIGEGEVAVPVHSIIAELSFIPVHTYHAQSTIVPTLKCAGMRARDLSFPLSLSSLTGCHSRR